MIWDTKRNRIIILFLGKHGKCRIIIALDSSSVRHKYLLLGAQVLFGFTIALRFTFRLVKFAIQPASWSSGNALVSGAEGLRCKSWVGQIGHGVANGSPPLRHFFE